MFSFDQTLRQFATRVGLPALAVLIGAVATVVMSLYDMADEVNRIEATITRRSVEASLQVTLRRIGETQVDYAQWDDAVRNLYGPVKLDFVVENFATSTADPVFFDTAFLIDEDGRDFFAYHDGLLVEESAREVYGTGLTAMMAAMPKDDLANSVQTGILDTKWGFAAVAIGPVLPISASYKPMPTRLRYLILSKAFDDEAIARLAEDYQIEGLHLRSPSTGKGFAVPVVDPTGKVLADLAWSPRATGDTAHARVSPTLFAMLALVALIVIILLIIVVRSLREVEKREAEARYSATHDGLTGLPNRSALVAALSDAIAAKRAGGEPVAIAYLDLDGFKDVNDAYGHETGDTLLKEVASGFQALCGEHMIARIGGDEFAVVFVGANAAKVACDVGWQLISFVARPFDIGGRAILIGTSVGVAAADTIDPTADELLRRADVAMYQAKQQGRNRMFVYDALIDTIRHERLEIADDLRRAMKSDDLELHYQPIFDAGSGTIVGVEALLRWTRLHFGPVAPAVFVSIAEETGLINELGEWTLRRACRDALAWPQIKVAVNVSPVQFRKPGFELTVAGILADVGFPAERLEIEITENYILVRPEQAQKTIEAIRNLGVSVALDDFGTGYSSIGYLRNFTFDKLKLDRSVIAGIVDDQRVQRFVQATIALADALELKVTAEGVETEAEATLLRLAGCGWMQGFYFARPSTAATIAMLLSARPRTRTPHIRAVN